MEELYRRVGGGDNWAGIGYDEDTFERAPDAERAVKAWGKVKKTCSHWLPEWLREAAADMDSTAISHLELAARVFHAIADAVEEADD